MDFLEVVQGRRSIRRFKPDPLPRKDIEEIIRIATLAPSASNRQMWRFIAISNKDVLLRMRAVVEQAIEDMTRIPELARERPKILGFKSFSVFMADAPMVIAVCGEPYRSSTDELRLLHGLPVEPGRAWARPDIQSISAAVQNLTLAAYYKGYGTVWMTSPLIAASELEKILRIREPWRLVTLVPIGMPDEHPGMRSRKPVEEVLQFIE